MIDFTSFAQEAGRYLDAAGVVVIVTGVVLATLVAAAAIIRRRGTHELYRSYRHNLARSILIGLEFLVAGDIIRSVAGQLTFDGVIILAIIVIIRTLLSMQLEMEIEGRWPWQRARKTQS